MIKDIVVSLTVDASRDFAAEYAVSVAKSFEAHLTSIGFAYEAVVPGSVFSSVAAQLIAKQRAEAEKAARTALSSFDEATRRVGLLAESHFHRASIAESAGIFGRLARRFDISVVAQSEPDKGPARDLIIEAALFESGRPVLVVPYIQRKELALDRVMVCWDGSRNAARAVSDAMPFLLRSKSVEVVVVTGDTGKSDEIPGADIAHHLARHGLKIEVKRIAASDLDVTNTILSHAADAGSNFIIMGGYGHSRLREFVLGGATRGILTSMTVPTLMSH